MNLSDHSLKMKAGLSDALWGRRFEAARQVRRHAVARDGCQLDQVLREEIVTKETVGRDRAAVRGTPSAHCLENQRRVRS